MKVRFPQEIKNHQKQVERIGGFANWQEILIYGIMKWRLLKI